MGKELWSCLVPEDVLEKEAGRGWREGEWKRASITPQDLLRGKQRRLSEESLPGGRGELPLRGPTLSHFRILTFILHDTPSPDLKECPPPPLSQAGM